MKHGNMWMYVAPGSGVSINVGRTRAFDTMEQARGGDTCNVCNVCNGLGAGERRRCQSNAILMQSNAI